MTINIIPSDEQNSIINKLIVGNVYVDSVAGAGKTTTALLIAKYFKDLRILLLTYNARLKEETREKINIYKLNNLEAHSYHAFGVKYYDNKCSTDSPLKDIIKRDVKTKKEFSFDLIIIDEVQDMKELFFRLVIKIFKDNKSINRAKLCILGDVDQCINEYVGADSRYLSMANVVFKDLNTYEWSKCILSQSFRVPSAIADFVNNCMLKRDKIKAFKTSLVKPRYIACNCFGNDYNVEPVYNEIIRYLEGKDGENIYKPDDIFILAPSVRNPSTPVRLLSNRLKDINNNKYNVFVPDADNNNPLTPDIIKNKLVFTTFNQVKGLERKVVILFNFDSSYFDFFEKNSDPNFCTNLLYVAATRSLERLTIFHHYRDKLFNFLNIDLLTKYCTCIGLHNIKSIDRPKTNNVKPYSVNQLLDHIRFEVIDDCYNMLYCHNLVKINKKNILDIPCIAKFNNSLEDVSNINGVAIPAYFEYKSTGKMTIFNDLEEDKGKNKIYNYSLKDNMICSDYLELATKYTSYRSDYNFKIYQILNYNWLSEKIFKKAFNRISKYISSDAIYEEFVCYVSASCDVTGFIDCIDNNIVWEFKCVKILKKEHFLQLALYMFLHKKKILNNIKIINDKLDYIKNIIIECKLSDHDTNRLILFKNSLLFQRLEFDNILLDYKYQIFNILDGSVYEIITSYDNLEIIFNCLLKAKNTNTIKSSDDEFLNNINTIINEIKPATVIINTLIKNEIHQQDIIKDNKIIKRVTETKTITEETKRSEYNYVDEDKDDKDEDKDNKDEDKDNNKDKENNNNNIKETIRDKLIILDTETSGFGNSKILQYAYIICNLNGDILEEHNIYINDGSNTQAHFKDKLSLTTIKKYGISVDAFKNKLQKDLNMCKYIVCHCISFDINMLRNYSFDLNNIKFICTMIASKDIVKSQNKNKKYGGGGYKYPKLPELYKHFHKESDFDDSKAHTANYDTHMTYMCLLKLLKINNLEELCDLSMTKCSTNKSSNVENNNNKVDIIKAFAFDVNKESVVNKTIIDVDKEVDDIKTTIDISDIDSDVEINNCIDINKEISNNINCIDINKEISNNINCIDINKEINKEII